MADFTLATALGTAATPAYLSLGGGSSLDETAPVVDTVSPTSATTLAATDTPITFHLYDTSPGIAAFAIWLTRDSEDRPYLVYDSASGFKSPFDDSSSISGTGASDDPHLLSIVRNSPGWWDSEDITIHVQATDDHGNVLDTDVGTWTTAANAGTVAGPVTTALSPSAGALDYDEPISFELYDVASEVDDWQLWIEYDGITEIAFVGSAFTGAFDANSTQSGVGSNAAHKVIEFIPDVGWPSSTSMVVKVRARDAEGNTSTTNLGTWTTGANPTLDAAPVVDNLDPVSGNTLGHTEAVEFDLYDAATDVSGFTLWLTYSNENRPYLIYDGGAFVSPFATYSTISGSGTSGDPFSLSIRPSSWPEGVTMTLKALAVDLEGNLLSTTVGSWTTETVTEDISSVRGSAISGTDGIARDLYLDPSTGDLALDGQDLALVRGTDAIAQALRVRMQFFLGEWFIDETVGLPFFQSILVKNPNFAAIREFFRQEIAGTPGVLDILSLELSYTGGSQRRLTVTYKVSTDVGEFVDSVVAAG